jgi:hypothetical protein
LSQAFLLNSIGYVGRIASLSLPVFTGVTGVGVAYVIGGLGGSSAWSLVPTLMVGWAIGAATDRTDACVRAELATSWSRSS